jgi:hypothetical protein
MRKTLTYLTIILVSLITALMVAEAAYRLRLVKLTQGFNLYDKSPWEFHEKFGYIYPPNSVIAGSTISQGIPQGCHTLTINGYGNIGRIKGDYGSASLKVLVFGDSFGAISFGGMTWPDYLQDRLEQRLGRSVHVVNFSRDGYGILQMFDLANAKVPEWRPDVMVFAFITDDLTRARFWRTVVDIDGMTRVLTTMKPNPKPELSESVDTFLLYRPATLEWCKAIEGTGQRDHVVEGVERVYHRIKKDGPRYFDPYTMDRSYLFNRIYYGDPGGATPFNPRHWMQDFVQDERFGTALIKLAAQPAPYFLIHLPSKPEYIANRYLLNGQKTRLLKSLERATGHSIVSLLDPGGSPVANPDRLHNGETDMHPSPEGQKLYADQVAQLLINRLNLH